MKTITIKVIDGEYQVPGKTARESEVYFTDSKADAMGTCILIHGQDIKILIRKVEEN